MNEVSITDQVEGKVAHDSPDTINPLKVGGKATTGTPTAVGEGDIVDAHFDRNGRLHVEVESIANTVSVVQTDAVQVFGNVGAGFTDNANPVGLGARAHSSPPTVSAGQRTHLYCDTNGRLHNTVQGENAHDSSSVAPPVVIGVVAVDGEQTAVAAGDTSQVAGDLNGRIQTKNYRQEVEVNLPDLEDLYDDTTTSNNSADVDARGYRTGTLFLDIEVTAGTPTRIEFTVEGKIGTNYFVLENGYLANFIWSDNNISGTFRKARKFPIPDCETIRVSVNAVGTDASNTFTINSADIGLGT